MNKKLKKNIRYTIVSFVLIYITCLTFGNLNGSQQDIFALITRYLFWSLPASLIIGFITYLFIDKEKL